MIAVVRLPGSEPATGALGGLNRSNAEEVIQNGANGIAVVSAICAAPDPQKAAEELAKIIEQAKKV